MFFYSLWPAFVWALIILILCFIPGSQLPDLGFWNIDKVGHIMIFGVLSFLLIYGFLRQSSFSYVKRKPYGLSVFVCAAYGGAIEIIQGLFIYKRSAEFNDFIADTLGALLFAWILSRSKFGKFLRKSITYSQSK
jgi:VanZ family protein